MVEGAITTPAFIEGTGEDNKGITEYYYVYEATGWCTISFEMGENAAVSIINSTGIGSSAYEEPITLAAGEKILISIWNEMFFTDAVSVTVTIV